MAPDAHANFAYSHVATAPSPASSGTSLVVTAGEGVRFPAVPFNATIWPIGTIPLATNAEIVRVTGRSTDTLTIVRAQESSSARSVIVGDQIAATITKKTFDDLPVPKSFTYITTGTTTYNLPAGITAILVEAVGGGGGGGGAGTAGSSAAGGSGGGGGGFARKWITSPVASYACVVGAGGAGGTAGANNGSAGTDSTFDSPSVCTGVAGAGGLGVAAATTGLIGPLGGGGGGGVTGDLIIAGGGGGYGIRLSGTQAGAGAGGSSGIGAGERRPRDTASPGAGEAGTPPGGGGSGGLVINGSAAAAGGAGANGRIIVWEFGGT